MADRDKGEMAKEVRNLNRRLNAADESCKELKGELLQLRAKMTAAREEMEEIVTEKDTLVNINIHSINVKQEISGAPNMCNVFTIQH